MDTIAQNFIEQGLKIGPKAIVAVLILLASWIAGSLIYKLLRRLAQEVDPDRRVAFRLLGQGVMVTMITIGIVSALGIIGIDVTALMAGLGLTGFILGFALKDALSNLLAGMLLLIYHPFKLGDKLMVAGFEGHVVAIDLRYTTLDNDGDKILVPNSMLFTNALRVSELKSTNNHKSQHNN